MESNAGKTILVTGATGRQGGAVARHLLSQGFKVTALTRHPDRAEAHLLARKGARIVEGDLDEAASLPALLEGAHGVFGVQNVIEHGFEGEYREGRNLIDAAAAARVKHFVYSSIASADKGDGMPLAPTKRALEEHLQSSGLPATILRPVYFMENFDLIREEIIRGKLRMPLPADRKLQMIAVDDIGAFAALAFANPGEFVGKSLDIAGAEMTMPQVAQIFSEALDREVAFEEVELIALAAHNPGQVPMFQWLSERGFAADIPALKVKFPWLKTFGEWALLSQWNSPADAQESPMHRPVGHNESPVKQ